MRNWLVLPVWASLGLLVYACDDDTLNDHAHDGGTPDSAPTSTATTPPTDAALPDNYAPEADAGPQPGPVTALVVDATGAVAPGVDVYFYEPGGAVVKVTTGADGKATHSMLAGGSIIANYIQVTTTNIVTQSYSLTTVVDVAPGDVIHIAPTNVFAPNDQVGQITGTIASAPATIDAGALTYGFDPGCIGSNITVGEFPEPFSLNVYRQCVESGGKVAALAVARDPSYLTVAYAPFIQAVPDGGTAIVANVAAGDWTVAPTKQMSFTGALPTNFFQSYTTVDVPRNGQSYMEVSTSAEGAISTPLTYATAPVSFAPNVEAQSSLSGSGASGESVTATHYQRVPSANALAEDFTKFLPRLHNLASSGTTAAPTISWQSDAPLPADSFATVQVYGEHTPDAGVPAYQVRWLIVFPVHASTTTVSIPAIPADVLALVNPDQPWSINQLQIGASAQAPYALAHQYPVALASPTQFASQIPASLAYDVKTVSICANCD